MFASAVKSYLRQKELRDNVFPRQRPIIKMCVLKDFLTDFLPVF